MSDPVLIEEIELYKHLLPRRVGELLDDARDGSEGAPKFDSLTNLVEELVVHVQRLYLSDYVSRAAPNSVVEAALRALSTKGDRLAMGDHVGLLRACLAQPEGTHWTMPGLAVLGKKSKLPESCGTWKRDFETAKRMREYEMPPPRLRKYLLDQQNSLPTVQLVELIESVLVARNAKAHRHSWWSDERDWYNLINDRLEPAVTSLLGWEPLTSLLLSYEPVLAVEASQAVGVSWSTPIERDISKRLVIAGGYRISSSCELVKGSAYIVARNGVSLSGVPVLFVNAPQFAVERRSSAFGEYQRRFVSALTIGISDTDVEREAARQSLIERVGLSVDEATMVETRCWKLIAAVVVGGADPGVLAEFCALTLTDGASAETLVLALRARIDEAVERWTAGRELAGSRSVSALDMARDLAVPLPIASAYVARMVSSGRVVGKPPTYELRPRSQIEQFRAMCQSALAELSRRRTFPTPELTLGLIDQLAAALSLDADDDDVKQVRTMYESLASAPKTGRAGSADTVSVRLGDETLALESVVDFYKAVYARMGQQEEFALSLPWTWGRKRRLAALSPEASGDRSAMTYAVGCPEASPKVYFDANATRDEAAYAAVQHLRKVGLQATLVFPRPECPDVNDVLNAIVPEGAEALVGILLSREVPIAVGASVESAEDERWNEVLESSAERFLASFLKRVVDSGLLRYEKLPVRVGKSRNLLSLRSEHPGGTVFVRPIRYQDVYVETGLSPEEAVNAALMACEQFGAIARRVDGDDDAVLSPAQEASTSWFVNVGGRSWQDMRTFGFWQAGGGSRYRAAVDRLKEGDRIYAYISKFGYVGRGVVTGTFAERLESFVGLNDIQVDQVTKDSAAASANGSDEFAEYVMRVEWTRSVDPGDAMTFRGIFTTPLTACRLRDQQTLSFLEAQFGNSES